MGRSILALALAMLLSTVVIACGGSSSDTSSATAAPVATETPVGTTPAETSPPADPSASEVATLFAGNCSSCHGTDGGGGSAPAINGEDNVDRIKAQIESGGDGMPAFSGQLTPGQIDALAQYVAGGLR